MSNRYAWQDLGESSFVWYEVDTGRVVAKVWATKANLAFAQREHKAPGDQAIRFAGPECLAKSKAYVEALWS